MKVVALLPVLMLAAAPALAHRHWDAHAAGGMLDAQWTTQADCESALAEARAAENHPASDIDPRLRDLFEHAACTHVADGGVYALRLHWPSLTPEPDVEPAAALISPATP